MIRLTDYRLRRREPEPPNILLSTSRWPTNQVPAQTHPF